MKTLRVMANMVIIGFVLGRAFNEWQHRSRTITVRRAPARDPLRARAESPDLPAL